MSTRLMDAREKWEKEFGGGQLISCSTWIDEPPIVFSQWGGGMEFVDTEGEYWYAEASDAEFYWIVDGKPEEKRALNHNEGKPRPSLILRDMASAFNELLKVREFGAEKYDRLNFRESIGKDDSFLSDNMDSIERHLLAHESGEVIDSESGCYHLAQVAVRCMFALEYMESEK